MNTFHLNIVTPDGTFFDGEVESVNVTSTEGGVEILHNHQNFVTTIGMGPAKISVDGQPRMASCIGGMLSMVENQANLIATTFEWADEIDLERAKFALERAEKALADSNSTEAQKVLAEAAKKRALVRISIAENK